MDGSVLYLDALFHEFCIESPREKEKIAKSEKRALRYQKVVLRRKVNRVEEHRRRRVRQKENARKGMDAAKDVINMRELLICIDLGFSSEMNAKERGKLIRQIGRVWGLQKRYPGLSTTLVKMDEAFRAEGSRIVTGFDQFTWNTTSDSIEDLETTYSIVYLSPDAEMEPLIDIDENTMYVIGGLVDESGKGSISRDKAESIGVKCRRLPIQEYMEKTSSGTFNVMLTINQVAETLCRFSFSGDWVDALGTVVPARTGYVVRKVE